MKVHHFFNSRTTLLIIVNIISLFTFFKILEDIINMESIVLIDLFLNNAVKLIWNPTLDTIMVLITNILNPAFLTVLCLILTIILIYKREKHKAYVLISSVILGLISEVVIKLLVQRARPISGLISETGFSFPSGHATIATIFFLMLIFTFRKEIKDQTGRTIFTVLSIILAITIGLSRIYLGVHWISDVLGGFALGIFWVSVIVLVIKIKTKKHHILRNI